MTKELKQHYEFRMDIWEKFLSKYPIELVQRHKNWISRMLDSAKIGRDEE